MHPLDEAITTALRDGPKTRKQLIASGVTSSESMLTNHLRSLCTYGMIHVVAYAVGAQKIYGLEPPEVPPTPPRHQADVVLELLQGGPMTKPRMERSMGRALCRDVLPGLEDAGLIERCGTETVGGNAATLWRLLRWTTSRTRSSPP